MDLTCVWSCARELTARHPAKTVYPRSHSSIATARPNPESHPVTRTASWLRCALGTSERTAPKTIANSRIARSAPRRIVHGARSRAATSDIRLQKMGPAKAEPSRVWSSRLTQCSTTVGPFDMRVFVTGTARLIASRAAPTPKAHTYKVSA
eukprot:scaffold162899_cov30-Tisochrysis_lutea.AAC.3